MYKITINVKFQIGQHVYRVCDEHKNLYVIISYTVDKNSVMYKIHGIDGYFIVYSFEIEFYEKRFGVLN